MLKIYENETISHPLQIQGKEWYIEHKYNGEDVLKFEIPDNHPSYCHLAEEVRITDGSQRYIIKKIDEHGGYVNVECGLDLDTWQERFWHSFRVTNSTLKQVFESIKPPGWSLLGGDGITKRATIEASEGSGLENVNSKDILSKASEVYEVVFNYDVVGKKVQVIEPVKYTPSGDYLTDELNLKSIGYVGSSSEFATRLYAYGKKDQNGKALTFSAINSGKEYIQNNEYSSSIISVGWSDERYTVAKNLLEAAKSKLNTMSYPVRSYECAVRNLDRNMYMYKVVTLVDRKRKSRIEHRVIEYKEYPEAHYYDEVTLSAVPPRIESSMKAIRTEVNEKMSAVKQVTTDAVLDAMSVITGAKGGHVQIELREGLPESLRITHSDGSQTVADEKGVVRGSEAYLYLIESGTVEFDAQSGFETTIRLPESYIGKDISVCLSCKGVSSSESAEVLKSINSTWSFDKATGQLTIRSDCSMYNIELQTQTEPEHVVIEYVVIGR
ncbi:hypothetical protein DWW31_18090 [Clostridium sp. AF15-17LB]|nr:hypothetical protein DWW31_18090 [Clostridium sp. AF15-17LB]